MSRHNAGEQAVSYQRLFPCPPCRPMIRNNKVFTQSLSLENYIKSTEILHEQSENKKTIKHFCLFSESKVFLRNIL